VNEYRGGRMPVFHFDTYRLKDEDEFLALGPDEYFESPGLTFVEWADRVANLLPRERVEITFDVLDQTKRRITLDTTSPSLSEAITRAVTVSGLM
jgi:tRNA threonylcarbamoyladenosine biosynthesis protein TsaE